MNSSIDSTDESENEVEFIDDERFNKRRNRKEYQVHWKGGGITWEPLENLKDNDGTENISLIRYDIQKDVLGRYLSLL